MLVHAFVPSANHTVFPSDTHCSDAAGTSKENLFSAQAADPTRQACGTAEGCSLSPRSSKPLQSQANQVVKSPNCWVEKITGKTLSFLQQKVQSCPSLQTDWVVWEALFKLQHEPEKCHFLRYLWQAFSFFFKKKERAKQTYRARFCDP